MEKTEEQKKMPPPPPALTPEFMAVQDQALEERSRARLRRVMAGEYPWLT